MRTKLLMVLTTLVAPVFIAQPTAAVVPAGGRVVFDGPHRYIDTRGGVPSVGPFGLPTLGVLYVTDSGAPGTATVYPCGEAPGPVPSAIFEKGETVYFREASSTPACVILSVPAYIVVNTLGDASSSPRPSGLQYIAAAHTAVVFTGQTPEIDRSLNAPPRPQLPFDLGDVPAAAKAAVLLLESNDPTEPGYAVVGPCGSAALVSDISWTNRRAVGVSYATLEPGSSRLCAIAYGGTELRITLLGFLQDDGPNPMALPPTLNFPLQDGPPPGLRAITPVRVLDTRKPIGISTAGKLAGGKVLELSLDSQVAESTTAVALNVTVTEPDGEGFLTVFPCDQSLPKASNLNYVAGETVPNLVNVKLSVTGAVCLYSSRTTHVVVDLMGTFERGGGAGAQSVAPSRLLDTRKPIGVPVIGKLNAGEKLVLQVTGRGGVPQTGVAAATLNLTATEADGAGFVTVYPCDRDRPIASNLNFVAGQTVPNLVTVRLSSSGTVCLFTSAGTHLVADIAAWYSLDAAQGYRELTPQRILDTRESIGVKSVAKLRGGETLTLQVSDRGGVPATGALAVTMNVTVTDPEGDGFLTVYPCDGTRPEVSNLNYSPGETVPNLVTVKLSAAGTVCLFAQRTTDVVADVAGYFTEVPEPLRVASLIAQN
jgi:hypothetical protein